MASNRGEELVGADRSQAPGSRHPGGRNRATVGATEYAAAGGESIRKPGKSGPATSHFIYPRPPLRDSTKEMWAKQTQKAIKTKPSDSGLPSEGSVPISSEPAPSHRPWISARARPLADRSQYKTTRKRLARLVMFLDDPADTRFGHI